MTTPVARGRSDYNARLSRQLSRLLVLMLLSLAAGVGLAGPAAAHDVLTSSDPTDGSTLQSAPTTVRLTFDQPVQNFEPVVTVIGPDGQPYESGAPQVDSTVVTAGVGALPVAGAYVIAYRVVSADGHPVQGEIHFNLAEGAVVVVESAASSAPGSADVSASSAEPATAGGSTSAGTSTSSAAVAPAAVAPAAASSGLSGWVWAAIALAALLVAAAIVVMVRRPRQPE